MTVQSALVVACAAYDALKLSVLHYITIYITYISKKYSIRTFTVSALQLNLSCSLLESEAGSSTLDCLYTVRDIVDGKPK